MSNYNQLAKEQARVMGMSAVPVIEEDHGNASTDGSRIFVNPSFMSKIETDAGVGGVRFILGHELGHIHHGMAPGHAAELDADDFGARSVAAMNYDTKVIAGVMKHLGSTSSATHPGSGTRESRAMEAHRRVTGNAEKTTPNDRPKHIPRFPKHR